MIPFLSGRTCLLFVSLRILHIDQDLTTASFQSFHSEHSWLQHLVAMRLNTCIETERGDIFCKLWGNATFLATSNIKFLVLNKLNVAFVLSCTTILIIHLYCSYELCRCSWLPTRSIGFGLVWEKLFGPERSSRLQLCFGELRQVSHH